MKGDGPSQIGGELVLVLGGARAGKSHFAMELVRGWGRSSVFIATAEALDAEMASRIAAHRAERPRTWRTREVPLELPQAIVEESAEDTALLVDCLTLWLSNLMAASRDVEAACEALLAAVEQRRGPVVLVSNEVGLGIVPDNALARAFRDHAGRLHQRIAQEAERVVFLAAGLPLELKSKN